MLVHYRVGLIVFNICNQEKYIIFLLIITDRFDRLQGKKDVFFLPIIAGKKVSDGTCDNCICLIK